MISHLDTNRQGAFMKRILLATATMLALAIGRPAAAADLRRMLAKATTAAPVPAPD
jgi:hypothetical protein